MSGLSIVLIVVIAAAGIWALLYSALHIADDVQKEGKDE
jgi:hypothetical protein